MSLNMILSKILDRFVEHAPITVMARATMEHALASRQVDELFEEHAEVQYTRELLFSSVVDVMGMVVGKIQPSVHAAYQSAKSTLPVSITALYDKLNCVEPQTTAALVRFTAQRLSPVVAATGGALDSLLSGYRVRIIDGNHLAATQRRLQVLKGSVAGPLPGHSLVVLDPQLMLATDMIPCEDGHAQERSLSDQILSLVQARDVWVADRNFCTGALLEGICNREGFFAIRQHGNLPVEPASELIDCGSTDTGKVLEQMVRVRCPGGNTLDMRRVVVQLHKPTRDGDGEMAILTNLPADAAASAAVAELYRKRWKLETVFQSLTQMLAGEIDTLAYPRAALLGFAVALASFNILSTVQAALRGQFGVEKITEEVSGYYIANEIRITVGGMQIATEPEDWRVFQRMTAEELAQNLVSWARYAHLPKYKRHVRGEKKPVPKRTKYQDKTHVSTARLLANSRKKSP